MSPNPLADPEFLTLAAAVGLQASQIVAREPSTFLGEMSTGLAFAPVSGSK